MLMDFGRVKPENSSEGIWRLMDFGRVKPENSSEGICRLMDFGEVKPENSSEEVVQEWREGVVLKNSNRRFHFKRHEPAAMRRTNQVALELKLLGVLRFLSNAISNIINRPIFWRLLGFGSSIVGFSCYALSPTFKYMIGEWNWWKIAIYMTVSSVSPCILLFVKELGSRQNFILKANVCFLVFLASCVYSYYQEKSEAGKNVSDYGRMLSMFSFGGFALMSLSLSRLTNIGFEMGVFSFFLTGFFTCAIKINLKVAIVTTFICYVFFYISDS